jgi:DNA repair protein RecO (recombination protein O)
MDATCYGCYFLEFADYYGRENADDMEMLKLLYQSVRALCRKTIPYPLIRCIYELKIMVVNGEYPQCFECVSCHNTDDLQYFSAMRRGMLCGKCRHQAGMNVIPVNEAAVYTLQYIISSSIEKLYTFHVSDEVLSILKNIVFKYRNMYIDRHFKSLDILTMMEDPLSTEM